MLTPEEKDAYEERAAIREFDGKQPRREAERAAYLEIIARRKHNPHAE